MYFRPRKIYLRKNLKADENIVRDFFKKNISDASLNLSKKSPRVLIIRLDYIGDMLCTTALMSAIRHKFPNCYLAVLAQTYNRSVIENNTDIDDIFQYIFSRQLERNPRPNRLLSLLDRVKLLLKLRHMHFDYIIIPNGDRYMSSVQFAWQLGAKNVCSIDDDFAFDDRVPEHVASRTMEHETLAGFRVAKKLLGDIIPQDYYLQLNLPLNLHNQLSDKFPRCDNLPVMALNFSARVPERVWSLGKWCKLAVKLAEQNQIVIFGAPDMWNSVEFKFEAASSGLLSLATAGGKVKFWPTESFLDMAAAIADCDILVSTDGGAVHVGAALRKPVVVLFENRPEKYKRWYPWGVQYAVVVSQIGLDVAGICIEDTFNACMQIQSQNKSIESTL